MLSIDKIRRLAIENSLSEIKFADDFKVYAKFNQEVASIVAYDTQVTGKLTISDEIKRLILDKCISFDSPNMRISVGTLKEFFPAYGYSPDLSDVQDTDTVEVNKDQLTEMMLMDLTIAGWYMIIAAIVNVQSFIENARQLLKN